VGAGADAGPVVLVPTHVVALADAVGLSNRGEGESTTFAIRSGGTVLGWGADAEGAFCGVGMLVQAPTPIDLPVLGGALVVRNSDDDTCALFPGGVVQCCGRNDFGALGDGTTKTRSDLAPVLSITGALELTVGGGFALARMADGSVRGWGYNQRGYIGNGGSTDVLTPVTIPGLNGVIRIAASPVHACAELSDRSLECWGRNIEGQLGDGTTQSRSVPTPVPGIRDVVDLALGAYNTCVIVVDGAVYCWGDNTHGQLGIGVAGPPSTVPVKVQGL
jgi:alpha-tubulin suppressor-like RCC1 family protein